MVKEKEKPVIIEPIIIAPQEEKKEIKDDEKERIISNYKQLIESIKKYAKAKGLNSASIGALQINHLDFFNINNCLAYIKKETEKPKSADELLNTLLVKGVTKELIEEVDKYFKSKIL